MSNRGVLPQTVRGNVTVAILIVLMVLLVAFPSASRAGPVPIGLGTAHTYAILAGSTITNTGPTTIDGDVGLHPGTAVTGFGTVTQTGQLNVADGAALQAKNDLTTAYNDAAGRTPGPPIGTELGGQVLPAGVYTAASGTFEITGALTLDGEGDPNAVFIFQMASTLVTASASSVVLINGANACNIFWQVGSSATLGTASGLMGTILALESITVTTGAHVEGRTLARTSAVTLDTNDIDASSCAAVATPSPAPTSTPTLAPTATPTLAPTPTPTLAPTLSPTPTLAPTPTPTLAPTPTPTPTAAPTATPTPAPTATPIPSATPTASPTPIIQLPVLTPTPTPTMTPTPTPTSTSAEAPVTVPTPTSTGSVAAPVPTSSITTVVLAKTPSVALDLVQEELPVSGAPIRTFAFLAFGLIAAGAFLRRAARVSVALNDRSPI
jgi:type VI secretion system secreted protein VgrG